MRQHCRAARRQLRIAAPGAVAVMILVCQATAQNSGTAIVSGAAREETGPVSGAVVIIAGRGVRLQTITAPDGSFQFTGLRTGKYLICASANETVPRYVDSCLWHDRASQTVTLAPNQTKAVVVPIQRGYFLQVRVNDPSRQLPVPLGRLPGNRLSLAVQSPSGLVQQIPIVKQEGNNRDHGIVIPYDKSHRLIIHSSTLLLKDGRGDDIRTPTAANIIGSRGVTPQPFIINVVGRRP